MTYDNDADALYVRVAEAAVARTTTIDSGTLVDLDDAGHLIGIEVLRPSRRWPLEEVASRFGLPAEAHAILMALFGEPAAAHQAPFRPQDQSIVAARVTELLTA